MATGGIRRWVRLVLDRRSSQQMEQEAQQSLDKGTDPQQPTQNLSRVERGMGRLRQAAVRLGAAIAAAFAVRQITRFVREAVGAAEEIHRSRQLVRRTLENEGIAWEEVGEWMDFHIDRLWETHRLTEGEVLPTFRDLFDATGDVERALRASGVAADISATGQLSTERAARLLGRALRGDTNVLERYNIELDENRDILDQLEERYGGLARESTTALDDIRVRWDELKEAIGLAILDVDDIDESAEGLVETLQDLEDWVDRNRGSIQRFGEGMGSVGRFAARVFGFLSRLVQGFGANLALAVDGAPALYRWAMNQVQIIVIDAIQNLIDTIPGAGRVLGEDFGGELRDSLEEEMDEAGETLKRSANAWLDTLADIWGQDLPGHFSFPDEEPEEPELPSPDPDPIEIPEPDVPDMDVGVGVMRPADVDEGRRALEDAHDTILGIRTSFQRADDEADNFWTHMQERSRLVGMQMTSAFEDFFQVMFDGFRGTEEEAVSMAEAVQGVGGAMVGALSEGMADYHTAQGAGKLADGLWPPNPSAIASAMQHFAAAGLFRALGGMGGGGSVGAPSSGGGPISPRPQVARTERIETGTELHVHIDPNDPSDPVFQDHVHAAGSLAQERHGGQARVKVHRRR